MTGFAHRFATALRHLEDTGDASGIAGLFAPAATLSNPLVRYDEGGEGAAERFWSTYRGTFANITSTFRHIAEADGAAFLEWTSEGTKVGGEPFRYGGVTVLEHDGTRISAFRTYFDSAKLSG